MHTNKVVESHQKINVHLQENSRETYKQLLKKSIRGKPQYKNLSQAEIKKYAKDRTEEIASKPAALHDPDQELVVISQTSNIWAVAQTMVQLVGDGQMENTFLNFKKQQRN